MKISFIIASLNRDEELRNCIASIERAYEQKKACEIEIIVIYQGSQQIRAIPMSCPSFVSFHYIKEKGLSIARNFAIKKSSGEFLVFLDDDATIKEDFIEVMSKIISSNNINAFCGAIIDPVNNIPFARLFNNKSKSLNRFEFMYFMGSAHVLKKTVIEKIGFYDEKFGAGAKYPAAEESDIFFRLKHRGEKVIYQPELIFYHPINSVTSAFKRFNYSYAVGAMLTKQIFLDSKHLFIYLFIISEIVFKSFLRTLQTVFFLKSIEAKNTRFRYRYVLMGTLKGVCDYIKSMRIRSN